jgi:hypothetical protein
MEMEGVKPRAVAAASAEMHAAETPRTQRGDRAGVGAAKSEIESNDEGYDYGATCVNCLESCFVCLDNWLPKCVVDCLEYVVMGIYNCLERLCGWNQHASAGHADRDEETHHDTGTVRTRESDAVEHDGPANLETTITGINQFNANTCYLHTKAKHIYAVTGGFSIAEWNQNDPILIADDFQTPKDGTQSCTNLNNAKTIRVKMYLQAGA